MTHTRTVDVDGKLLVIINIYKNKTKEKKLFTAHKLNLSEPIQNKVNKIGYYSQDLIICTCGVPYSFQISSSIIINHKL